MLATGDPEAVLSMAWAVFQRRLKLAEMWQDILYEYTREPIKCWGWVTRWLASLAFEVSVSSCRGGGAAAAAGSFWCSSGRGMLAALHRWNECVFLRFLDTVWNSILTHLEQKRSISLLAVPRIKKMGRAGSWQRRGQVWTRQPCSLQPEDG